MNQDEPLLAARRAFRNGSRSFATASLLFDRTTRRDVTLLYAWCRHCDDTIDGQILGYGQTGAVADKLAILAEIEVQTRAAFALAPIADPAFAALQQVARHRQLPMALALDHLAGFRMDVTGRLYRTIEDTLEYCHHIAGVVGLMMAHVMGQREPAVLARAADLGVAFQLTNIARDVVEDAANGRVYLPDLWLREAGLARADITNPAAREALANVVNRLLDLAETFYQSAGVGIAALPPRAAWAIATASAIYRDIGHQLRAQGPRAWDRRCHTTPMRKLVLAARSLGQLRRLQAPPGAILSSDPAPQPEFTRAGRHS